MTMTPVADVLEELAATGSLGIAGRAWLAGRAAGPRRQLVVLLDAAGAAADCLERGGEPPAGLVRRLRAAIADLATATEPGATPGTPHTEGHAA